MEALFADSRLDQLKGEAINYASAGNLYEEVDKLSQLGWTYLNQGEMRQALTAFRQAIRGLFPRGKSVMLGAVGAPDPRQAIGDHYMIELTHGLGYTEYILGAMQHSFNTLLQGLQVARRMNSLLSEARIGHHLAMAVDRLGGWQWALRIYDRTSLLFSRHGPPIGAAYSWQNAAEILALKGKGMEEWEQAAHLAAMANRIFEENSRREADFENIKRLIAARIGPNRMRSVFSSTELPIMCTQEAYQRQRASEIPELPPKYGDFLERDQVGRMVTTNPVIKLQ